MMREEHGAQAWCGPNVKEMSPVGDGGDDEITLRKATDGGWRWAGWWP